MKSRNSKFLGVKILLIFGLVFFTVLACKVETAPTEDTTYTVTFDANGGTPGSLPSTKVKPGETIAKPSATESPSKPDYDIAYWSTKADDYSTVFDFDKKTITSDITIYPHYRYKIEKVLSHLSGPWLETTPESNNANKIIIKLSADDALNSLCFAGEGYNPIYFSDNSNADILQALLNLNLPTSQAMLGGDIRSTQTFNNRTINLTCQYKQPISIVAYKDTINNELTLNSTKFFSYVLGDSTTLNYSNTSITVVSIDTTQNNAVIANAQYTKFN